MFEFQKYFMSSNSLAYITWWNKMEENKVENVDLILQVKQTISEEKIMLVNSSNKEYILDNLPYYL